ncbi:acetyltransferase, GNAT family [Clostridiales bacterium oral taxon 876 str. F0540]|nr:acetyltransferase, GNAT family [Clostridiales bacterium oral taxon 876 str. F0540]
MIIGEKVILREFQERDLERMHQWVNNEEITKNLSFAIFPRTLNDSMSYLKKQLDRESNSYVNFVISEKNDPEHKYIGSIGLKDIDYIHRKGELNIALGYIENMSKGYGTDAVKLILEYGFNRLGLNKIYLRFIKFNEGARKAYEKAGLKYICEFKEDIYYKGNYYSQVYMEVLRTEYFNEY